MFYTLLMYTVCICIQNSSRAHAGAETEMSAHVGETVSLPCHVDTKQCGELHSVKWYRDKSRIYVFSHHGGIAKAEGDATDRMTVIYSENSAKALLQISPLRVEDEASYKCEITYLEVRENCDVVQIVKLVTLVEPSSIRMLTNDGVPLSNSSIVGPKFEGSDIEIICEAIGGKPVPKILWFNGSSEIDRASYTTIPEGNGIGTGRSQLRLTLSRGDLNAKFECQVESKALSQQIISWIFIDVMVRPTKLELHGPTNLVAGGNAMLICDVYGARPAAEVKWFNGSDLISNDKLVSTTPEDNRDGTYTTKSSLIFMASRYENGKTFHCFAQNKVTEHNGEAPMHDNKILEVQHPPVVTVSPSNITVNESASPLLSCTYVANPQELTGIVWTKDGKNLTLNNDRYEGGTTENPALRIKSVTRDDLGEYVCWLKNKVDVAKSDGSIFLNVLHPPDVEVVMDPFFPVKARDRGNITLECNVTSGNPSSLLKVRWFMGRDLLKELPECNYTGYDKNGDGEGNGGPFCEIDPTILSLERVDETFAGKYTCQGENLAGWGPVSQLKELMVYYPPSNVRLSYHPANQVIKNAFVRLECVVENLGQPENITYIWYRGSKLLTDQTSSNYTINPVTLEARSNYTCIAKNEGGESEPKTIRLNVSAPPFFIKRLQPYQRILYDSKNISLTCRVECWPLCAISWMYNEEPLDIYKNSLYFIKTDVYPADQRKNDFESIESTLFFNMTKWPGQHLDTNVTKYNYSCHSSANGIGRGIKSEAAIIVDYPPQNVRISYQDPNSKLSKQVIHVTEGQIPEPIKCFAEGHPTVNFTWTATDSKEILSTKELLQLKNLTRLSPNGYVCEASNEHGKNSSIIYFNVLYTPKCTISSTEKDGRAALLCSAESNPQEVSFTWHVRESNETFNESNNIVQEQVRSFLILDSTVDISRTYLCIVNNSVGAGEPCKSEVAGTLPWWKDMHQDKLLIVIAASVTIILCVIVICIIIIILCRKKRAGTKLPNQSTAEDKTGLGFAPPPGYPSDPTSTDNDPNKGFYENLPFHGIQNPPNKPISVIAPFMQSKHLTSSSTKSLLSIDKPESLVQLKSLHKVPPLVKRNQSFSGFQNPNLFQFGNSQFHHKFLTHRSNKMSQIQHPLSSHMSNLSVCSQSAVDRACIPTIFYNLPQTIRSKNANSTFSRMDRKHLSNNGVHKSSQFCFKNSGLFNNQSNPFSILSKSNPSLKSTTSLVSQNEIRTSMSGINIQSTQSQSREILLPKSELVKFSNFAESKFGSLELKKHKCYSPTFYSMRCKKHSKKRPLIYAVPKEILCLESLNDHESLKKDIKLSASFPVPAPRCRKHRKVEIIYQNISESLKNKRNVDNTENSSHVTKAEVHKHNDTLEDTTCKQETMIGSNTSTELSASVNNECNNLTNTKPKLVAVSPKVNTETFSTLKVTPTNIKPKSDIQKGALSLQLQAKINKISPIQLVSSPIKVSNDDDIKTVETLPDIPQMPLLDAQNKNRLGLNVTNRQNSFYTLTTPHLRQTNAPSDIANHYSASLPHSKHKLIPRALFQQEQSVPKSKSFSSKAKHKKHFQIPLQKSHSFKFQTAESYFQPIKNLHEENLMKNGYVSDYAAENSIPSRHGRHHKRDKHKPKSSGPLILKRSSEEYHDKLKLQENVQNSVHLQYPQPLLNRKPNGIVYADLDMPKPSKKHSHGSNLTKSKHQTHKNSKSKTEYATLKFNDIGQEIDV